MTAAEARLKTNEFQDKKDSSLLPNIYDDIKRIAALGCSETSFNIMEYSPEFVNAAIEQLKTKGYEAEITQVTNHPYGISKHIKICW